jgi:hypothetical protein
MKEFPRSHPSLCLPWQLGKPYRLLPRAVLSAGDFTPAIPAEQGFVRQHAHAFCKIQFKQRR